MSTHSIPVGSCWLRIGSYQGEILYRVVHATRYSVTCVAESSHFPRIKVHYRRNFFFARFERARNLEHAPVRPPGWKPYFQ